MIRDIWILRAVPSICLAPNRSSKTCFTWVSVQSRISAAATAWNGANIIGACSPHRVLRLLARYGRPVRRGSACESCTLKPDGHCVLVEPFAGDGIAENLNPVGRLYYGASSLICVLVSLARRGPALGPQAGERRLRRVMVDHGGFTRFRRATQTPFNLIFEARP